jgi:hypothetical protein
MLLCEINEDASEYMAYGHLKTKISIGELMILDGHMLKVNGRVPLHNQWMFLFANMFED